MCLTAEFGALALRYPNFAWHFTITRPSKTWRGFTGRVTDRVPELIDTQRLEAYHFHLVGNGEMVHLVRQALLRAGALPGRVSIETYFNHYAEPPASEIEQLANRLRGPYG